MNKKTPAMMRLAAGWTPNIMLMPLAISDPAAAILMNFFTTDPFLRFVRILLPMSQNHHGLDPFWL
jgi:hypothetical protein